MRGHEYQKLAMRTMADQEAIRQRIYTLGPKAVQLDSALRGLMDEVGEIANAVKKYIEYGQPLDENNLLEEAGDVFWRTAQLLDAIGMTVEEAMNSNIAKLQKRYPMQYSDELAEESNRKRQEERAVVEQFMKSETGDYEYDYNPHKSWQDFGAP